VARVQDTDKFVDEPQGCHSGSGSVNDATHAVTVFVVPLLDVFLSGFQHSVPGISNKFLIDSGYKPPIQNMDELFASDIKLAYPLEYSFVFENGDVTEVSKVQRNHVNCTTYVICVKWATYQINV